MEAMQFKLPLPIFFFVLLLAPSIYSATKVNYCDDRTKYAVKVTGVDISPNPVKRGKVATFKIAAHTDEALSGGTLNIGVQLFGISVYSEDHDLCQETSCPVTTGDFVISHSQKLPGLTPPELCFECKEEGHWKKSCPWLNYPCVIKDCPQTMKLWWSTKDWSKGCQFMSCRESKL